MGFGWNIHGHHRAMLAIGIVAVSLAMAAGALFLITDWPHAKTALLIAAPLAVLAVVAGFVGDIWPHK
jgi:peptidoglycan/LPS O-acetylase OafA/YrhL